MKTLRSIPLACLILALLLLASTKVTAHCDTLDGPVVETAKLALEKGDVTPVIKWVRSSTIFMELLNTTNQLPPRPNDPR